MSSSPDSSLLLRTIELNYTNKKRSNSFKWIVVNSIFFLIFAYDLWCGCECGLGVLHYVEAGACGVAAANLLQHVARTLPARRTPLPLTPAQRRLLGLQATKLGYSSFREVSPEAEVRPHTSGGSDELELSPLARARSWGGAGSGAGTGTSPPPSPSSPQHSPYSSPARLDRDEFIADHQALADYLR
ncbi:unnamed protein product [Diatraea saccharalis]|uniref:Uncharacterized protein n=1 Tax=Diatraea saccharalis TaxID=40085 RepID=A0A9N9RG31_9NEOP|nr:unnamed protein product [Diatraea saccharalis]